jgi:threonyl-tRNA synthetase
MSQAVKVNATNKFAVFDPAGFKGDHKKSADAAAQQKRSDMQRATAGVGDRMTTTGLIGGDFSPSKDGSRFSQRTDIFEKLYLIKQAELAAMPQTPISVTLPDGTVKEGLAYKTSPMDIALSIAKGLADSTVIAKVEYATKVQVEAIVACDDEGDSDDENEPASDSPGELWDMNRPLVGNCKLSLLKFDDPEAKTVFWHSSAHVLGAAIEATYGCHLTIGPALNDGFYYDAYMGKHTISEDDTKKVEAAAGDVCKKKYEFQRLVLTKDQALDMFESNPFKTNLIRNKVPNGSLTTVYRCGPLIDLCMGPHIPNTGKIKAFATVKTSSTNWLGQVTNDPLQRVYGIAFPDKAQLKQWKLFQEQAKKRDHRLLGTNQELFFFHQLSPGSCFWLPHGARIYNKLCDFIRTQYWARGYQEVITPNVFNLKLWEQSGHAQHYKDSMFIMDVEGAEWGMKPMNCPGHCLLFAHRVRSYKELPLRVADFGVLHRNELSGALTGLTRVRRFCQDDAHIFCTEDQIEQEVLGCLDFMRFVYTTLGMTYKLELSTRPKKALGEIEVWNRAEAALAVALNKFVGEGQWRVNAGDGAFYGPKIDIKVFDAMNRVHQCATIQLDFQLPIRFDLNYRTAELGDAAFARPVMVHRAMLGSVERMSAVLAEHWGGKWPYWLSPRQCQIVPVDAKFNDYAFEVQEALHKAGHHVDVDDSARTLNKKVREAQMQAYNLIFVVGEKEKDNQSVCIRVRDQDRQQTLPLALVLDKLRFMTTNYTEFEFEPKDDTPKVEEVKA